MIVTNYTPEDLKKLPLWAIVALSARCARRVEHQARLPDDHPETARCRTAVEAAAALGHSDHLLKAAIEDYEKLLRLDLGSYPQAGDLIDPSTWGPLGPLEPAESLR
jgi:hypothetical protein